MRQNASRCHTSRHLVPAHLPLSKGSPMLAARSLAAALSVLALTSVAHAARDEAAPPVPASKQVIEVVGFSSDGREVFLRVDDENTGLSFQVRDAKKGDLVKTYPFQEDDEKRARARLSKAHDGSDAWVDGADNPRKEITLMTAQKGKDLVIYMMKGDRIVEYERVPLLTTRKKEPAKSFVKQVAWDPRGKYAAVVYHQEIQDLLPWEGDFVHTFKFKSYRVSGAVEGDDE